MNITKAWITKDSYFGQVEELQFDYRPDHGPHEGHSIHHRESYENCGAMNESEYCIICNALTYASKMNGCWQQSHQREESGKAYWTPDEYKVLSRTIE